MESLSGRTDTDFDFYCTQILEYSKWKPIWLVILFSHNRAVEAAMLFLKAAGYLQESSYSREPFLRPSRHFLLDESLLYLLSKIWSKTFIN